MRTYLIEDLGEGAVPRIEEWLRAHGCGSAIEGSFRVVLPVDLLDPQQAEHTPKCGDHYLALETGPDWIKLEFLVRCRNTLSCPCMRYAGPEQARYGMDFLDGVLKALDIPA
ncbi:MAG: hypothetical protein EOM25_09615 [Deltaproteobacteria bacterium]|nr:hypothetical protein [Deltaproteobacteria bacterium]